MQERTHLAILALAAELIYVVVAFIPTLPLIIIQAIVLPTSYVVGISVMGFIFVWWAVQPNLSTHFDNYLPVDDSSIKNLVNSLAVKINAPPIHKIILNDDLNAGALQTGGMLSLFGVKRTLFLGIPLLHALSLDETKAVIAHELGHFSKNHGELGHWIYRVRGKWAHYLHSTSQHDDFVDAAIRPLARRFVPRFLELSSNWSKACEFEADTYAASSVTPTALISALAKLKLLSYLENTNYQNWLRTQCQSSTETPTDYWGKLKEIAENSESNSLEKSLAFEKKRSRKIHDTHPPIEERAGSLNTAIQLSSWQAAAGFSILGEQWHELLKACNARWAATNTPSWNLNHYKFRRLAKQTQVDTQTKGWLTGNAELDSVVATYKLDPSARSLMLLRNYVAAEPSNPHALFYLGEALLNQLDVEGVEHLKSSIKLDSNFGLPSSICLLNFYSQCGSETQVTEAQRRYQHYLSITSELTSQLWSVLMKRDFQALPEFTVSLLREAIDLDIFVDGAWVVSTALEYSNSTLQKVNLIVVRINHAKMTEAKFTEDDVISRYSNFLQSLVPPNQLCRILTKFNIEPINPHLYIRLCEIGELCLKKPLTEVNKDIIKIDSL
jgi:Zn-dependent protease with chaperone function